MALSKDFGHQSLLNIYNPLSSVRKGLTEENPVSACILGSSHAISSEIRTVLPEWWVSVCNFCGCISKKNFFFVVVATMIKLQKIKRFEPKKFIARRVTICMWYQPIWKNRTGDYMRATNSTLVTVEWSWVVLYFLPAFSHFYILIFLSYNNYSLWEENKSNPQKWKKMLQK